MSVSRRVHKVSPKTRQDLELIWRYTFETWSLQQADGYYNQLVGCFPDLANGTKRGRKIDDVKPGYLALPFQSHFILYKENERAVTIMRILHRRMNITAHL